VHESVCLLAHTHTHTHRLTNTHSQTHTPKHTFTHTTYTNTRTYTHTQTLIDLQTDLLQHGCDKFKPPILCADILLAVTDCTDGHTTLNETLSFQFVTSLAALCE
jgi:hypothetical protein